MASRIQLKKKKSREYLTLESPYPKALSVCKEIESAEAMAGPRKKPQPAPRAPTSTTTSKSTRKRSKKSPSPKPASKPPNSTELPPPSSITPSSSRRRTRRSYANNSNDLASSPLTSKLDNAVNHGAQSSPIRATKAHSLPSPSPEHPSKSSPIKRKKVMFNNENLVNYNKLSPIPALRKSILKHSSRPPQMNPLIPQLSNVGGTLVNPSNVDFWTQGNIPRLTNPNNTNEELNFFKSVLHGGVVVLDLPNCDKQFEIYATINLLLKDLTDRKILILLGYLPELTRLMKKDIIAIETQILNNETTPNPFMVRINIQITKILTQLISNIKLVNSYWKKSKPNFDYVKWCISHSSSIILKPTISKSLLTANLQLIKDHKIHSYLNLQSQEFILYALLNMKFFNSSSLLVERLYTLKSLIINHTLMMEKNAKSWLPFLFNCLCDFQSPLYQKQQQVAVQCLLESSKLYIASRNINFEIKSLLNSPIHKTLQLAPDSQISFNSSPLDLQQTTFHYITIRINDLIRDQCKVAMDLWLGLTLLLFNDPGHLNECPIDGTEWHEIVKHCLRLEDNESRVNGVRAYKGLIYVMAKNIRVLDASKREGQVIDVAKIKQRLGLIFQLFELVGDDYPDVDGLVNCMLQIIYALLNNPLNSAAVLEIVWPFIVDGLKTLKAKSTYLEKICIRIFNHLVGVSGQQRQNDVGFYLMKCVGNDRFDLNELSSLSSEMALSLHESIFQNFMELVWDSSELLKVRVSCLSNLLNSFKPISHKETDLGTTKKLFQVIEKYSKFFTLYLQELNGLPSNEKLEYINKFILMLKTNFGYRVFYKITDEQVVFNLNNVFVHILNETTKSKDFKTTDVLKFTLTHIKSFQYKFFESLVLNNKDRSIHQYVSNNLESKIFEKSLAIQDIQSIGNIIAHLPKSKQLLTNYLSYISKYNVTNGITFLNTKIWPVDQICSFTDMISDKFESLSTPLIQDFTTSLQLIPSSTALKLFNHWLISNDMWLLIPFREHIYFHIIDPENKYSNRVHLEALVFLKKYVKMVKDKRFDYLDEFISHGFQLCSAMKKDGRDSSVVSRVESDLKEFISRIDLDEIPKTKSLVTLFDGDSHIGAYKEVSSSDLSQEQKNETRVPDDNDSLPNSSYKQVQDVGEKNTVEIPTAKELEITNDVDISENDVEIQTTDKPHVAIEVSQGANEVGSTQRAPAVVEKEEDDVSRQNGEKEEVSAQIVEREDKGKAEVSENVETESIERSDHPSDDATQVIEEISSSETPKGESVPAEHEPEGGEDNDISQVDDPTQVIEDDDAVESNEQEQEKSSTQVDEIMRDIPADEPKDVQVENQAKQVIETQNTTAGNHIQKSSSMELTADWMESTSSDHEFYDARANVESSPTKRNDKDSFTADVPASDDKFYDSHEDQSLMVSKELVEPVDQVVETQEIPDSNELLKQPQDSVEEENLDKNNEVDETDGINEGIVEEEKENEIPSDSLILYSSPLKTLKRKLAPLNERFNEVDSSPIKERTREVVDRIVQKSLNVEGQNEGIENEPLEEVSSGTEEKATQPDEVNGQDRDMEVTSKTEHAIFGDQEDRIEERSKDESQGKTKEQNFSNILRGTQIPGLDINQEDYDDDDDDGIIEIDNDEFAQSIRESSPPTKRPESRLLEDERGEERESQPRKRLRLEDSSALDVLAPPDLAPVHKPVDQISKFFDGFTDEQINKMDDREVYEMENRLLAFMMRMRSRKQ